MRGVPVLTTLRGAAGTRRRPVFAAAPARRRPGRRSAL